MKIIYLGNFNDCYVEGLLTLLREFKKYFSDKYELIFNDISNIDLHTLIHIHSSGFFESVKYVKYAKLQYPLIYSLHSNGVPIFFKYLKDSFEYYVHIYVKKEDNFSFKDRVIKLIFSAISNFIPIFIKRFFLNRMPIVILPNKWLVSKLKLNNSYLIRQGIDVKKFKKNKEKIPSNNLLVCYFGHPTPGKGFLDVINVFSKLDSQRYSKNIFATSINKKIIKYVSKKDPTITIKGLVKNIVSDYNSADILVLPYRHSAGAIATPLVLIEAMACQCAIITSDLPHLREICGDSVIYVKPCDSRDMLNKIEYLNNNPLLRKRLGKKARQRVVKYYNKDIMLKQYEEL